MKRAILILLLTGCDGGEGGDIHEVVDCSDAGWTINQNPYDGDCELGCVGGPTEIVDEDANGLDDRCPACAAEFLTEFNGRVACCRPDDLENGPFLFAECE